MLICEQKEPMTSAEILAAVLKLPKLTQKQSSGLKYQIHYRPTSRSRQEIAVTNQTKTIQKIMQWSLL